MATLLLDRADLVLRDDELFLARDMHEDAAGAEVPLLAVQVVHEVRHSVELL